MIRVPHREGWLLIPQPTHAWLSGILVRYWGNAKVTRPEPYEAIKLAATLHDLGWLGPDATPSLNSDGQPQSFLEPSLDDVHSMYTRTVVQVTQIDPYAGLLINRHVQLIYTNRGQRGRDPITRIESLLANLRQAETAAVEGLQSHPYYRDFLDAETLHHNYRILRVCDLLSLFVCGAIPPRTIAETPRHYGEAMIDLRCSPAAPHHLRIQPNVFEVPEIVVHLTGRYIDQREFASAAAYAEVFAAGPDEVVTMRITGADQA